MTLIHWLRKILTRSPKETNTDIGFKTAYENRVDRLYNFQRFDAQRLAAILKNGTIYCSNPATFNDPWDCKPWFNTAILDNPDEYTRHVKHAEKLCRPRTNMSEADITAMVQQLSTDRGQLERCMNEISTETVQAVMKRFRVYCLGPDPSNTLMWAHYADSHRGICLEFDVKSEIMCGAFQVEYYSMFPIMNLYSESARDNLLPLLAKAAAWRYEKEYRLVAQEEDNAVDSDTLKTRNNFLVIPEGASLPLKSVIVGCQGPFEVVSDIVNRFAPDLPVKRAIRVPNHYEVNIEG